jgi:flavin reductase (DIM6/NTAB) family NADH-FMN oxidoreductase RutF
MRRWASGVAVVTSGFEGQRHGMTASSFISTAVDPPLVLVSLNRQSRTRELVARSGRFGVSVLNEAQREIAQRFAGVAEPGEDRFVGIATFSLDSDVPLIAGGLACFDCRVNQMVDVATTTLFVGQVEGLRTEDGGRPLVYYDRAYHEIV